METEKQIKASFKVTHDDISEWYYSGKSGMDKATFDHLHGAIWADMESELIAMGYLTPPVPARDLPAEIDALIYRIKALETRGPLG